MRYKKLFIILFLAPCALDSTSKIDSRIAELKNNLAAKEIELSKLSNEIAEKEILLHSLLSIGSEIYRSILNDLADAEQSEFKQTIQILEETIENVLKLKNNTTDLAIKEAVNRSAGSNNKIEKFKSLVIVRSIENFFLKRLFQSLADYLQDIMDIREQLTKLQPF